VSKVARLVVVVALVTIQADSAVCSAIFEREQHGHWADVVALPRGAHVRISDDSGRIIKGQVQSATDGEIVIADGGAGLLLPRDRVRQVELRTGRGTGKGSRRGFRVGLTVGTALGVFTSGGIFIAFAALTWGGLGAAVGAASGRLSWHYELVYQTSP
jgi:hypothetical protein